jgi:hypothetical protein
MASVSVSNLIIEKGISFSQSFDLSESLSGCSGTSHIRKSASSSRYTPFILTITDESNGIINLSLTSEVTSTLKSGRHVYDVLITRGDTTKFIAVEGMVNIRPGISTACTYQ